MLRAKPSHVLQPSFHHCLLRFESAILRAPQVEAVYNLCSALAAKWCCHIHHSAPFKHTAILPVITTPHHTTPRHDQHHTTPHHTTPRHDQHHCTAAETTPHSCSCSRYFFPLPLPLTPAPHGCPSITPAPPLAGSTLASIIKGYGHHTSTGQQQQQSSSSSSSVHQIAFVGYSDAPAAQAALEGCVTEVLTR